MPCLSHVHPVKERGYRQRARDGGVSAAGGFPGIPAAQRTSGLLCDFLVEAYPKTCKSADQRAKDLPATHQPDNFNSRIKHQFQKALLHLSEFSGFCFFLFFC